MNEGNKQTDCALGFDERFQLRVCPQDMAGNPGARSAVQIFEGFQTVTVQVEFGMKAVEEFDERGVLPLVLRVRRTAMAFHTLFLKSEMGLGVLFEKVHEADGKTDLLRRRAGVAEHILQLVDVQNQHLVLVINGFTTRLVFFIPANHNNIFNCMAVNRFLTAETFSSFIITVKTANVNFK